MPGPLVNAGAASAGPGFGCKSLLATILSARQAVYFLTTPVFCYELHCKC